MINQIFKTKLTKKPPMPLLRKEFRANILAHATAFIINIGLYAATHNYFFIWLQIASLSFIGVYNSRSNKIIDFNLINHFISVMLFYLISMLIGHNESLYLCLIFIFTYIFFILKNNGYHHSFNLWMYIQALLIGTTFTKYPFSMKLIATCFGFIEAMVLLNIMLLIFKNNTDYQAEPYYHRIIKIPAYQWLDNKRPEVKLAIRGAFTAAILYAICTTFNDIKPNWAVVTAVICLTRDDKAASLKAMIGMTIGTIIGWPICLLIAQYLNSYTDVVAVLTWLFLLIGLIYSFEATIKPRLITSVFITISLFITVACVSISLNIDGSIRYINLKGINSVVGIIFSLISLMAWEKLHRIFDEIKT